MGVGAYWGGRLADWLNKRHPFVSALVGALFFLLSGGLAAVIVDIALRVHADEAPIMVAGSVVGVAGLLVWVYAFTKGFDVPVWVGRSSAALTLAIAAAAVGAIVTTPPLQVLCASAVAARLLPQTVFAIIQGLQDVRDPKGREARFARAMTMAQRK